MLNNNVETPLVSFSFDESSSSSEPFESSSGTTLYFGGPNMWYNVPDGLERNPDVIRAEMSLMTTPMSQMYAAEAYGAVKNVQNVCAADYKTFCASASIDLSELSSFLDNFMMPRLLTETKPQSAGAATVNKLRSYYRQLDNKPAAVVPKHGAHIKTGNLRKVNKMGTLRRLDGKQQGPPLSKEQGPPGSPPPKGPPPKGAPPRGPPPPPEDGKGPHGPPPPAGAGSWFDPVPPKPADQQQPPPPPPAGGEDVYFNGALGFGAEGDMCLYENFNRLSQPCVQGMTDLYEVRQRFWHDNEEYSGGGHHIIFLVLAALFLWMIVKKCIWRKRIAKVRNFMEAVHANPALKATIEAETGLPVPEMPCRGSRCCDEDKKGGKDKCCLKKFCKYVCGFMFMFAISFFLAITSLEITSNILVNWDADAEARGEEPSTTPLTALLLLLTVTLVEVTIFALAVRVGKTLCAAVLGRSSSDSGDYPAPSAPPASPVVVHTTPMPTPEVAPTVRGGRRFQWGRALTVNPFSRMFSNNAGATHGDYTALSGGDNEETEMVTVTSSVVPPQHYLTPVLMSNGQTVLASVSAAPVTKVTMV